MLTIQDIDLDDNRLLNALLHLNPSLTGSGLKGKFGINTQGAIVYIANYSGSGDPILGTIKELIPHPNEDSYIIMDKVNDNRDWIQVDINLLITRILKDGTVAEDSTWSSQEIVNYLGAINPVSVIYQPSDPNNLELDWWVDEATDNQGNTITGVTWGDIFGNNPSFDVWMKLGPQLYQPMEVPININMQSPPDDTNIETVNINLTGNEAKIKITI